MRKGCEYCSKETNKEMFIDEKERDYYAYIEIKTNILEVEIHTMEVDHFLNVKINYCPMCGRKL